MIHIENAKVNHFPDNVSIITFIHASYWDQTESGKMNLGFGRLYDGILEYEIGNKTLVCLVL